jgi:hypothetical protein
MPVPVAPVTWNVVATRTSPVRSPGRFEESAVASAGAALSPSDFAVVVTDAIRRIGSLQFLSATIIRPRREVIARFEGSATTQITPSLKVYPTFSRSAWGLAAVATF